MNRFFDYYFAKWWRPIVIWLSLLLLFIISEILSNGQNKIGTYEILLILFGMICLPISADKQTKGKNDRKSSITWVIFVLSIFCLIGIFVYGFLLNFGSDHYADDLKIPSNLQADSVIDLNHYGNKRLIDAKKEAIDFQLYKTNQSGMYEFDFWIGKIEPGEIYIRVFEITEEDELGDETFPRIKIENPTDTIKRFGTEGIFIIYEGDWEVKYAARFEVWFKPSNGEADRKLLEKNYIIDGWQH